MIRPRKGRPRVFRTAPRRGADALFRFLLAASLLLALVGVLLLTGGRNTPASAAAAVVLCAASAELAAFCAFRFLSRHIGARERENDAFLRLVGRLFRRRRKPSLPPDTETHTFRACPRCGAVLRLPIRRGRHTVVCPRCSRSFKVRVR